MSLCCCLFICHDRLLTQDCNTHQQSRDSWDGTRWTLRKVETNRSCITEVACAIIARVESWRVCRTPTHMQIFEHQVWQTMWLPGSGRLPGLSGSRPETPVVAVYSFVWQMMLSQDAWQELRTMLQSWCTHVCQLWCLVNHTLATWSHCHKWLQVVEWCWLFACCLHAKQGAQELDLMYTCLHSKGHTHT